MNTGVPIRPARIASVDVVRLVAFVAIVIGHVYTESDLSDRLVQSWRLPVFFMLSGYFWSARRFLRDEVQRRGRTLLRPYLAWLLIIAAVALPVRALLLPDTLHTAAIGVVLGGSYADLPFTTFWFFTALFVATVVYRALQPAPTAVRLAVVAVGLGANLLAGPEIALVPWSVGTALGALVFLEAGRAVRLAQDRLPPRALAASSAAALLLATVLLATPSDFVPLDMKEGQFPLLAVPVALGIGAALLLAATAAPPMPDRAARFFTGLAKPSLVVIVAHPFVIWVLRGQVSSLPLWAVTAAAFLAPLALGLVLMRTRLAPWLVGVDRAAGQRRPAAAPV